jgi:hypothetical protein
LLFNVKWAICFRSNQFSHLLFNSTTYITPYNAHSIWNIFITLFFITLIQITIPESVILACINVKVLYNKWIMHRRMSIIFKEWRDTRTFSNIKSTHCTLLILFIINLVTKKVCVVCIVSKVQSIKLLAPCWTLKVQREQIMERFDNRFTSQVNF